MQKIPLTIIPTSVVHWLLLAIIASVVFVFGLGSVHLFDWDEINFAEIAREMIATGNYSRVHIDFAPFYEKPPLFFWLQVLSMKLWGIHEFSARFPNALLGGLTLASLYGIGKAYKDTTLGLLWALMHGSALLPPFYFKTGIIDPVFNYCIFLGIYALTRSISTPKLVAAKLWAMAGGGAVGMAILAKGPVGILIPCLTLLVYWSWNRFYPPVAWSVLGNFFLAALIIPLFWFGYETYQHGITFLSVFIQYQITLFNEPVAGHAQPFYYHFLVILLGCFPASILALGSFCQPKFTGNFVLFPVMHTLFWVVMILFSLVTTKIVHYSSLAYFPVTFLAAHYLYSLEKNLIEVSRIMRLGLLSVGILIASFFIVLPLVALYKERWYDVISDEFVLANLAMPVPWSLADCLVGMGYLLFIALAYRSFQRLAITKFAYLSTMATILLLTLGVFLIVPKIEAHTQKPVIEFYKSLTGQSVYVTTVGFKSYAPLFYFRQPEDDQPKRRDLDWLLTGDIDKPVYLVVKITDTPQMALYPDITCIGIEGGFAFYRRDNK